MKFATILSTLVALPLVSSKAVRGDKPQSADKPQSMDQKLAALEESNRLLAAHVESLTKYVSNTKPTQTLVKRGYLKTADKELKDKRHRNLSGKKYYGYGGENVQICYDDESPLISVSAGEVGNEDGLLGFLGGKQSVGKLDFGFFDVYYEGYEDLVIEFTASTLLFQAKGGEYILPASDSPSGGGPGPSVYLSASGIWVSPVITFCGWVPEDPKYGGCGWKGYAGYDEDCVAAFCAANGTIIDSDAIKPAASAPINANAIFGADARLDSSDESTDLMYEILGQIELSTHTTKFFVSSTDIMEKGTYQIQFYFHALNDGINIQDVSTADPKDPELVVPFDYTFQGAVLGPHIVEVSKVLALDSECAIEGQDDYAVPLPSPLLAPLNAILSGIPEEDGDDSSSFGGSFGLGFGGV